MLNIVVMGEFDSGKSTLIGRLLYDSGSLSDQAKEELLNISGVFGKSVEFVFLLDSFEEERRQALTLDMTQAVLKMGTDQFLLTDVPGHRQLISHMLTGTCGAEVAILVVDVRRSMESQTKRHLYLAKFLGIPEVLLVVNKMDLVGYRESDFLKVQQDAFDFLVKIGFSAQGIVPVSAKDGENLLRKSLKLSWYRGPFLAQALCRLTRKTPSYDFRFPVQDVYETKNERIAVGTVASGRIQRGDVVTATLTGSRFTIKDIKVFGCQKKMATAQESIGLILEPTPDEATRGTLLFKGKPPKEITGLRSKIFCLEGLMPGEDLWLQCAIQEKPCRISNITKAMDSETLETIADPTSLRALDAAEVVIETQGRIMAERFQDVPSLGRFVLKKNGAICAIGIVD
ncbi:MAG: GTP-binding protein [Candidatus Omnitrophota bacterium]